MLGAFWLGHHRLLADVPRVNDRILWLNVLYLGLIALLPFPTDVLGRYGDQRPAVMLYAAAWRHIPRRHLPRVRPPRHEGLVVPSARMVSPWNWDPSCRP